MKTSGYSYDYISEFIYGGMDGIITTVAIISGTIGADLSSKYALILCLSNVIADGFSMGVSNYNSLINIKENFNRFKAFYSAFYTFFFFVLLGSIPLIPFLLFDMNNEVLIKSMLLLFSLIAFSIIGIVKGIYTKKILMSFIEAIFKSNNYNNITKYDVWLN